MILNSVTSGLANTHLQSLQENLEFDVFLLYEYFLVCCLPKNLKRENELSPRKSFTNPHKRIYFIGIRRSHSSVHRISSAYISLVFSTSNWNICLSTRSLYKPRWRLRQRLHMFLHTMEEVMYCLHLTFFYIKAPKQMVLVMQMFLSRYLSTIGILEFQPMLHSSWLRYN